jgi:hypothetical protein
MKWDSRQLRFRQFGLLLGICGCPPIATASYLIASRWLVPAEWWGPGLAASILLGLAGGLICIAMLPEYVEIRIFLAILYVPAACAALGLLWVLAETISQPPAIADAMTRMRPRGVEHCGAS